MKRKNEILIEFCEQFIRNEIINPFDFVKSVFDAGYKYATDFVEDINVPSKTDEEKPEILGLSDLDVYVVDEVFKWGVNKIVK